ncbi:MAG: PIG-L deacetylase family protein [Promethearchaeota archaeon]
MDEKSILVFLAHPDDTDVYCPNLIHDLVNQCYDVHLCCFTRGEFGILGNRDPNKHEFEGKRLGRIRSLELRKAANLLGIPSKNVHFLEILDSKVRENTKVAYKKVISILKKLKPNFILAPEFYKGYYQHPDHIYAGMIIFLALKKLMPFKKLLLYHSMKCNYYHPVSNPELGKAAVSCHESQKDFFLFLYPLYSLIEQVFNGIHVKGFKRAEGYRITSPRQKQNRTVLSRVMYLFFNIF